jgi:hypothetical protein
VHNFNIANSNNVVIVLNTGTGEAKVTTSGGGGLDGIMDGQTVMGLLGTISQKLTALQVENASINKKLTALQVDKAALKRKVRGSTHCFLVRGNVTLSCLLVGVVCMRLMCAWLAPRVPCLMVGPDWGGRGAQSGRAAARE